MTDMPQILQSCGKILVKPDKTASWSFIQVRNCNFCRIWACFALSSERNLMSYRYVYAAPNLAVVEVVERENPSNPNKTAS